MSSMPWKIVVADFNGLVTATVNKTSVRAAARRLTPNNNRSSIRKWMRTTLPQDPSVVAAAVRFALEEGVSVDSFQTFGSIYKLPITMPYEECPEPPDLDWMWGEKLPPNAPTKILGLNCDTPLGCSASPLTMNHQWTRTVLDLGFGFSFFKTRRSHGRESWPPPQVGFVVGAPDLRDYNPADPPKVLVSFTEDPEGLHAIRNIVNSIGVPSEGMSEWQAEFEQAESLPRGRFLGISVLGVGESLEELLADFERVVSAAAELRPPAIELNVSCPNLKKHGDAFGDPSLIGQVCARAHGVAKGIPLVLKLPQLLPSQMKELLQAAARANLEGVSFKNTIKVRAVQRVGGQEIDAFNGRSSAGLSGPCTFRQTREGLKYLVELRKREKYDFEIIAVGGVSEPRHVVALLNEGADYVQACTAIMFDPLLAWKTRFHFDSIKERSSNFLMSGNLPETRTEIVAAQTLADAIEKIQEKRGIRVPYDLVVEVYSDWRSSAGRVSEDGVKFSEEKAPSIEYWIRELSKRL